MKRTLFTIAILFCASLSYAQKINYGIKGGINIADQTTIKAGNSIDYKHFLGFNAGGFIDLQYSKVILQSGLYYTTKGFNYDFIDPTQPNQKALSYNVRLHYFEIPLNFLYRNKISNTATLYLGGGPYIAYNYKGTESINDINDQNYTLSTRVKNPDYGVNFLAGIKLKNKYSIDASYGLGLANLGENITTTKNTVISLSLGYQFN